MIKIDVERTYQVKIISSGHGNFSESPNKRHFIKYPFRLEQTKLYNIL
jgi:hypothetical protein